MRRKPPNWLRRWHRVSGIVALLCGCITKPVATHCLWSKWCGPAWDGRQAACPRLAALASSHLLLLPTCSRRVSRRCLSAAFCSFRPPLMLFSNWLRPLAANSPLTS
ncbi:MAG: DUF6529 family protein [Ktedonobacterales bacterium]